MIDRCPASFPRDQCYAYLRRSGLDYGPMFRGIERAWQGDRESLGLVSAPRCPRAGARRLCVSSRRCSMPAFRQSSRRIVTSTTATRVFTCRMRSRRSGFSAGRAIACGFTPACWRRRLSRSVSDVDIYNEDGQAGGTGARPAQSSRRGRPGRVVRRPALCVSMAPPTAIGARFARNPGGGCLRGRNGGLGTRLAQQFRARGDSLHRWSEAGSDFEDRGEGRLPDQSRPAGRHAAAGPGGYRARVKPLAEASFTCGTSTHRPRQALSRGRSPASPGRGSTERRVARPGLDRPSPSSRAAVPGDARRQSVADRPEPAAVAQAPAIGLGRVIAGEYPRLRCKLVDLDPHADDGDWARSLWTSSEPPDEEDEVAWRGPERYVHRYLPAPGLPPEGARGPAGRLAVPAGGAAARDARWPCPSKTATAAARPGRGRDRGRRRRPQLQ